MRTAARELHHDQRGAVMLIGLGMSCFLIGALWFLIGIGDAIVFRDAMQEAADHAAFTSAVLHAKGMNFISACNLILVALFAIHIIMGIIHDILLAICIIWPATCGAWLGWRKVYTGYAKIMKPTANVIHYAELGAAYGYPYIALAKGYTLGREYGNNGSAGKRDLTVLALSTSLIPGAVLNGPINKIFGMVSDKITTKPTHGDVDGKKKGLPVEGVKFNAVCKRIGKLGLDFFVGLSGQQPSGKVYDVFKGIVGNVLAFRYCNDMGSGSAAAMSSLEERISKGNDSIDKANDKINDKNALRQTGGTPQKTIDKVKMDGTGGGSVDPGFDSWWGKEGPLVPWWGGSNGSPWYQVWSVNLRPVFKDGSEHRVAIADKKFGVEQSAQKQTYFAQAEFYYDCTEDWPGEECNWDDNAGYGVKWRARLRRLQFPEVGSLLTSFGADFLKHMQGYNQLKEWLGGGAFDKFGENVGGAIALSALGGGVEAIFTYVQVWFGGQAGNLGKMLNPKFGGIYH